MAITLALAISGAACSSDSSTSSDSGSDPSATTVASGASDTGLSPEVESELSAALSAIMEANDVPGAVMAVSVPGYEPWVQVEGLADVDTDAPMTAEIDWPLRSITKSFTVTVLLQLVDEGVVSLDDTIDQYVADIPNGDQITLAMLADMSAGSPDYTNEAFGEAFGADPTAAFTPEELIGFARTGEPLFDPGAERVYVNANTLLLGAVIEEATGSSLTDEFQERIFDPLGLDRTVYETTVDAPEADLPSAYQIDEETGEVDEQPVNFTVFGAAGAMRATVGDMLLWADALGAGDLISAEARQGQRADAQPLDEGPEYDVYGQGTGQLDGWWGHTGEGFGITALVMHDDATGVSVAIAMNTSDAEAGHLPTKLFREVSGALAEVA